GGDGVEPFVHRVERERAQVYAAGLTSLSRWPDPDHLVVRTPVGAFEARANRQVAVAVVDVAYGGGVRARGKDRDVGQPAAARIHQSARVNRPQRDRVSCGALRNELAVDVVAADLLVQLQEFVHADRAVIQGRQPVLQSDVVLRLAGE